MPRIFAQQMPPTAAIGPHPGLAGLPGLGPGIPVPTSASAALLGLGIPGGANPGGNSAHPLSIMPKPDLHRGQNEDIKPNGGKLTFLFPQI